MHHIIFIYYTSTDATLICLLNNNIAVYSLVGMCDIIVRTHGCALLMAGGAVLRHLLAALYTDMSLSCDGQPADWSVETSSRTEQAQINATYTGLLV